jgi:poly(hydroxyalkanoate) granule-associated protein
MSKKGKAATTPPAGLGVLAKAQHEGAKALETLLKQGQRLEQRSRQAAADTAARAREVQQIAGGTWDKLEQVFEDRVARALSKLGVYTQNDVQRLAARVDELAEAVNQLLLASRAAPARGAGRGAKKVAKKVAKKTANRPATKAAKRPGRKAATPPR